MSPEIQTIATSIITAAITGYIAFATQKERLRWELRTEFMAEQVAKHLLERQRWGKRTFAAIKSRLGGFTDEELRRILVRAGAVRFEGEDGSEFWGLMSRNDVD
jgi:hypothetical protein